MPNDRMIISARPFVIRAWNLIIDSSFEFRHSSLILVSFFGILVSHFVVRDRSDREVLLEVVGVQAADDEGADVGGAEDERDRFGGGNGAGGEGFLHEDRGAVAGG